MANLSDDDNEDNKKESKKAVKKRNGQSGRRQSKKGAGDGEEEEDQVDEDKENGAKIANFFKPSKVNKRNSSKTSGSKVNHQFNYEYSTNLGYNAYFNFKVQWSGSKLSYDKESGRTFYPSAEHNGGEIYK